MDLSIHKKYPTVMNFKYPDNNEKFDRLKFLQISNDKNDFINRTEDEYSIVKEYLDVKNNIIDLGCGLGRSSIYFKNIHDMDNKFYMCDFNGEDFNKKQNCGTHNNTQPIAYNDLSLTNEFCTLNNLLNTQYINLENDDITNLENVDLLYSFHCVGYHWSIEKSFEKYNIENITNDEAILIFGIRNSKQTEKLPFNYPDQIGSFKLKERVNGKKLQDFLIYKKFLN